ncbi:MAG TPA: PD-(D/E)XK nuclease-like domain-containing protein [Mycobacteriales bacterium]
MGSPTADTATTITQPGIYDGMPSDVYHADPVPGGSLSSSGARLLLPPSCPALFRHAQTAGRPPKAAFDFGHAAHRLVLGVGERIVRVDAQDWRTKAAQQKRDQAYEDGAVPLLAHDYQQVQDMAAALRRDPIASALFNPESGSPEQSLFWRDEHTAVWRRARLDWLANRTDGRRLIVADYKTTASADPAALSKSMHTYGYHQQGAWYLDAVTALGLTGGLEPAFVLIFQEKTPPYLVTVVQPDPVALRIARERNAVALDTYRRCVTTGHWPGYADGVISLALPPWAEREHETRN